MGISWGLADLGYGPPERGTECFFCHKEVPRDEPAIGWLGAGSDSGGQFIWLHPDCTLKLIVRLTRDVHEVECGEPAEALKAQANEVAAWLSSPVS